MLKLFSLILAAALLPLAGCGGPSGSPVDELKAYYKDIPTYSIVLDDMKTEGAFVDSYFHKYRVVMPLQAEGAKPEQTEMKSFTTEWEEVPEGLYKKYQNLLGMTVYSKADGKESTTAGPPGYEYVGNKQYGQWRTDSSGNSFWVFYGQYRLLSDLLGGGRVYRGHYDDYRRDWGQGRTYYGPKKGTYGTNGTVTKKQKPNFYERRMARQSSFGDKVSSRAGRTKTGYRSRSGGVGK